VTDKQPALSTLVDGQISKLSWAAAASATDAAAAAAPAQSNCELAVRRFTLALYRYGADLYNPYIPWLRICQLVALPSQSAWRSSAPRFCRSDQSHFNAARSDLCLDPVAANSKAIGAQ